MKKKLGLFCGLSLIFATVATVDAAPVIGTWTGNINYAHGVFSQDYVGQSFIFTSYFDDTSTIMNNFTDGDNMIDEDGLGDDGIYQTYVLTDHEKYKYYDDIEYDLGETLTSVFNSVDQYKDINVPGMYNLNLQRQLHIIETNATFLSIASENITINLQTDRNYGFMTINFQDGSHDQIGFDNVMLVQTPTPIPIPPTIILFGTGLIGLIGKKLRKNYNPSKC